MSNLDEIVHRYFADYAKFNDAYIRGIDVTLAPIPSKTIFRMIENGDLDDAWRVVHELILRAPSEDALGFVATSVLEDLVTYHHAAVGTQILHAARRESQVRQALGMIYGWERVPPELRHKFRRAGVAAP